MQNMYKIYGIPNCNTVKKARQWFEENSIPFEFHDFKKEGADLALLKNWAIQVGWEALLNRKGLTWRGLSEMEKASIKNEKSAIQLMEEKTSIIKRPVIVKNDKVMSLGFDADEFAKKFKK